MFQEFGCYCEEEENLCAFPLNPLPLFSSLFALSSVIFVPVRGLAWKGDLLGDNKARQSVFFFCECECMYVHAPTFVCVCADAFTC